jgi:hypothetical protein
MSVWLDDSLTAALLDNEPDIPADAHYVDITSLQLFINPRDIATSQERNRYFTGSDTSKIKEL